MEKAGRWVREAIAELKPAEHASCPNELVMRFCMAMIRINNAFEDAGLRPIEVAVPFDTSPEGRGIVSVQQELFARDEGIAKEYNEP
jgi:hypothetical protein